MHKRNAALALYVIAPLMVLAAFSVAFQRYRREASLEQLRLDEIAAVEAAEKATRQREMEASLEAQGRAIAEAKAKALADKEAAIRQKKIDDIADVMHRLEDARQDILRFNSELSRLNTQLLAEREARTRLEHAYVERSLRISRLASEKDAADLDAQRLTGFLVRIIDDELDLAKQQIAATPPVS